MARDKRSRSGKPPENKQDSPSRPASTDTAVRVPSSSSSPTSAPAPEHSSDHNEELQAGPIDDSVNPSLKLETPQDQDASPASEGPVLTDDGALDSPQIEPGLGEIVEDSANNTPVDDSRSPTSTDQSGSPETYQPLYNLATELSGANLGSDDDAEAEGESQQTSPSAVQIDHSSEGNAAIQNSPATGKPQDPRDADPGRQEAPSQGKAGKLRSNNARPGRSEDSQKEKSKRIAAEKQVERLKAKLKAQMDEHENSERAAKERYDRAIQKANQAREIDKLKFEKKLNEEVDYKMPAEVEKFEKNIDQLTAHMESVGQSATGADSHGEVTSLREQVANLTEALAQRAKNQISAPMAGLPIAPRSDPRPGSARFLLAEYEYLLVEDSRVYNALRAMADYADGRGDLPSAEDEQLFDAFTGQVVGVIELMEQCIDRPNHGLAESISDWGLATSLNKW